MIRVLVLAAAATTLLSTAQAQEAARDGARAGAQIGAGVGSIVGGVVDGASRAIDNLTEPRDSVVIERRTVVVPSVPCVRTADGRRVCEGD